MKSEHIDAAELEFGEEEQFVDIELGHGEDQNHHQQQRQSTKELYQSKHTDDYDDDDDGSVRSFCLKFDIPNNGSDDNNDGRTSTTILSSGTCVICFENLEKDDVIVWSEKRRQQNKNDNDCRCNHVYHKECMVNYLASNAKRRIKKNKPMIRTAIDDDNNNDNDVTNNDDEMDCINPSPTCRTNFCSISKENITAVLKNKSLVSSKTILSEEDDDQSSSEESQRPTETI